MRVCFVVSEIFAFKRLGGYGKLVRTLGSNLVKRGIEVYAVTWRDPGQRPVECVDGITVYSFPYKYQGGSLFSHVSSYLKTQPLYRITNADVFHNIDTSIETYLAEKAMPNKKHLIHFQDPYDQAAHNEMATVDAKFNMNTKRRLQFQVTREFYRKACIKADKLCTQATCFIPKVKQLYNLGNYDIDFLPNPIEFPKYTVEKAKEPTVCFIGRWDPQKRVHLFLQLAKSFPDVKFIAMGKGHSTIIDQTLRAKYKNVPNLEMPGFVSEEEKSRIIGKSWITINTSIREGLPIAFLEVLAHKTAILSYVDPDNFASRFGYHAKDEDFEAGLKFLIQNDLWKQKGLEGYKYVFNVHEINKVVDQYIMLYESVLE